MEWIKNNVHELMAAANITKAVFLFILGTIILQFVVKHKFSKTTDIKVMLIGLILLCYSLAVHRAYWGLNRVAEVVEYLPITDFISRTHLLQLIPTVGVLIGIALMVSPALSLYIKPKPDRLYFIVFASCFSLFWFIFFKLKLLAAGI